MGTAPPVDSGGASGTCVSVATADVAGAEENREDAPEERPVLGAVPLIEAIGVALMEAELETELAMLLASAVLDATEDELEDVGCST